MVFHLEVDCWHCYGENQFKILHRTKNETLRCVNISDLSKKSICDDKFSTSNVRYSVSYTSILSLELRIRNRRSRVENQRKLDENCEKDLKRPLSLTP